MKYVFCGVVNAVPMTCEEFIEATGDVVKDIPLNTPGHLIKTSFHGKEDVVWLSDDEFYKYHYQFNPSESFRLQGEVSDLKINEEEFHKSLTLDKDRGLIDIRKNEPDEDVVTLIKKLIMLFDI